MSFRELLVSFLLVLVCSVTLFASSYGGGNGDPNNPYLIYTAEQMNEIGLSPNDWDKHFVLMDDIDLSGYTGNMFNIIGRQIPIDWSTGIALDVTTGKVYWSDSNNSSGNSNLFRGNPVTVKLDKFDLDKETSAKRICLDVDGGKIYWIGSDNRTIQCANLDGTEVEELFASTGYTFFDLALNPSEGKLYFTDYYYQKSIFCMNLDGTGFEEIVNTGLNRPGGIVVDPVGKKVYWTDTGTRKLQRSNLDGTDVEDVIISQTYPLFLDIDINAAKLYWYDSGTKMFHRGNLDGTDVEDLFSANTTYVEDIVLDASSGKLYWTNRASVMRANYDGTELEDLFTLPAFTGVFDGNVHTISSFQYNGIGEYIGLFGRVEGIDTLIQNVTLDDPNVISKYTAGCLVGYLTSRGTIQNCSVRNGSIHTSDGHTGGLCGGNYKGIIADCTVEHTSVTGQGYTGGISAINTAGFGHDYEGIVRNCSFSGEVSGGEYVGGLIGYSSNRIYNCSVSASVKGITKVGGLVGSWNEDYGIIEDCWTNCAVEGDSQIGGLIGTVSSGGTANDGYVNRCKATGTVIGTGSSIGGFLGSRFYGRIGNSCASCFVQGQTNVGGFIGYSTGGVADCYAEGQVVADEVAGGLFGYASNGAYHSYSTCSVSGSTVGGLYGAGNGGGTDCFWDVEASGVSINSGGTGLTTAEMKMYDTYFSWECENAWTIDEGVDYPRLIWENQPGIPIAKIYNYGGGSGTAEDPFLISTAEHLNTIGLYYCDMDKHFLQTADIDMSEYDGLEGRDAFNIIGTSNLPFVGVYDGNDFMISNLTIKTDRHLVGLFGTIGEYRGYDNDKIVIQNIHLENAYIESTQNSVGAIAGVIRGGDTRNCYVNNSTIKGYSKIGGIAGQVTAYSIFSSTYINDCVVNGIIESTYGIAGGIAGEVKDDVRSAFINGCDFYGTVTGENYLGGICGTNGEYVFQCANYGLIQGENAVGGIAGKNERSITESVSRGEVIGAGSVGGIAGSNEGWVGSCYSTGPVSGTLDSVGGLIGSLYKGSVEESYSNGTVSSDGAPGGLIGHLYSSTVTNSFWDMEASEVGTSAGGEGKTSEEMKQYETFVTWECSDNWTINVGVESPRLFWENAEGVDITPSNYGGGSGEMGAPFLIYTADHLYKLTITDCHLDKHFKVMADIDMSSYDGQEGRPEFPGISNFGGTFDGKDHVISNYRSSSALFQRISSNAVLRNIRMENLQIENLNYCERTCYCGGLAEYSNGIIENCSVVGGIVSGVDYVGGLVGYSYNALIKNCFTDVTVQGKIKPNNTWDYGVGGLLGGMRYGDVLNCHAIGNVSGDKNIGGLGGYMRDSSFVNCFSSGRVLGNDYVGGFAGRMPNGNTNSCFWDMGTSGQSVSAGGEGKTTVEMKTLSTFKDAGWDFIGDSSDGHHEAWMMSDENGYPVLSLFNGYEPSELSGSGGPESPYEISSASELSAVYYYPSNGYYALSDDIDISEISWKIAPIPFFAGNFDGRGHEVSNLQISGKNNLGLFGESLRNLSISDVKVVDVNVVGDYSTGALIGHNSGKISGCSSSGNIQGTHHTGGLIGYNTGEISRCYTSGVVDGNEVVGGLIGYHNGFGSQSAIVRTSTSNAKVTGITRVGGLCGSSNRGLMENCYSTSEVAGNTQVGGFTGYSRDGQLRYCYAAGNVSGESSVGEFCGYLTYRSDVFCYYLDIEEITGSRGIPLTDDQMKQQGSFENWDFVNETDNGTEDIWYIHEGIHYPKLWWQYLKPIANAGDDTVVYANAEGVSEVNLDGTSSYTEEGILEYLWFTDANELIAVGPEPSVLLEIGEHIITLVVNDSIENSEPDQVLITVLPNTPPVADAGSDRTIFVMVNGVAETLLDGTGSFDPDGYKLEYFWYNDANELIATGAEPNVLLPEGEHSIALIVNDGVLDSQPDYVKVNVLSVVNCQLLFKKDTLSIRKGGQKFQATLIFPEGFTEDQLDQSHPISIEPSGVTPTAVRIQDGANKPLSLNMVFNKTEFLQELDLGSIDAVVVGMLKDGRYFAGTSSLQIVP